MPWFSAMIIAASKGTMEIKLLNPIAKMKKKNRGMWYNNFSPRKQFKGKYTWKNKPVVMY